MAIGDATPAAAPGGAAACNTRILVVIPALNEAAHIESVLLGLLEERKAFPHLRIVVVDGGSSDGTPRLVESVASQRGGVELIHNPARIQSAGVNLAVKRFGDDADILVRCDAHSFYPPGFCGRLLETMTRVEADAVVVPMDSMGEGCLQRAVAWVSNSPMGTGGAAHRAGRRSGFVDHGHHAAFRMDIFRQVGGYDEGFTHNEDAELDCRQRRLGARIFLDSDIRIRYQSRSRLRLLWTQYFRYGAGRSRTVRRHPSSLRLRQMIVPCHLLACALAVSLGAWLPLLLVWPAFYLALLAGTSLRCAAVQRSPCGLLAGPAAGVMHTAWGCGFLVALVTTREQVWNPPAVPVEAKVGGWGQA